MESKANGSLMRIMPLGIWGSRFSNDELAQCAIKDSSLSHPNESCCYAVAGYVIAIASLIENPGNRREAFKRTVRWRVIMPMMKYDVGYKMLKRVSKSRIILKRVLSK